MRIKKIILAVILLAVILSSVLTADAATSTKPKKDIAIVFDNSGSMYKSEAWCRAKYAMEIFASMLDYDDGDRLRIYPMWGVMTDGSTPDSGGSYSAIEISSKNDIDKISRMYTVYPGDTPFEPVNEAHDYLAKQPSEEDKWLIVLTDGAFNQIERGKTIGNIGSDRLQSMLEDAADNGIKVQYLGFGSAASLTSKSEIGFFARNSTDTSLKDDLISICNLIFQRIALPESRLKGNVLDLDLSMENLVVFVQGQNVKINSLKDENGKAVSITLDSGQRRFSEISASPVFPCPVDRTLGGQVVSFGACPKGKYTLDFSGAETIQIFYEPDVAIRVDIENDDGVKIDPSSGELPAGKYTVTSTIVDRVTGEDVSKHELMGSDVVLNTFIKQSGENGYSKFDNGASFTLAPDSTTEIYVEATYLTDYKISTKDDPTGFGFNWVIKEIPVNLVANASVTQPDGKYVIQTHDSWQPIKVGLTLDGLPLTAEQMKATSVTAEAEGMRFRCEAIPDGSAYNVYIEGAQNGGYDAIVPGDYDVKITCIYKGEFDSECTAADSVSVTVIDDSSVFEITAENTQPLDWYKLRDHDSWKPIRVKMTVNGQPLTAEEMERVVLNISTSKDIPYRFEADPEGSAFLIYVGQNSSGEYEEPQKGKYDMKISASYTDEYGEEHQSSERKVTFEVQNYSRYWRWLFWLVLVAVIVILFLLFMNQKVLPNDAVTDGLTFRVNGKNLLGVEPRYKKKFATMSVYSPSVPNKPKAECSAIFDLYPVDNRWTRSSKRRIGISGISSSSPDTSRIYIDGALFTKNKNGVFCAAGAKDDPINVITRNPQVIVTTAISRLTCNFIQT